MQNEIIRFKAVQQAVSLSRTTIWRLEREGKFPGRRKLSTNSVGWIKQDVDNWIQSRAIVGRPS
jgi:prophage regulatory protein